MPFWCSTIIKYTLAATVAAVVSILGVFCLLAFVIAPHDDSPALGIAWFLFSPLLAALLVPLSLGFTAEIIERRVQRRSFRWLRASLRVLLSIPIMSGPIYAFLEVLPLRPDARSPYWPVKLAALSVISVLFGVLALWIKRDSTMRSA